MLILCIVLFEFDRFSIGLTYLHSNLQLTKLPMKIIYFLCLLYYSSYFNTYLLRNVGLVPNIGYNTNYKYKLEKRPNITFGK